MIEIPLEEYNQLIFQIEQARISLKTILVIGIMFLIYWIIVLFISIDTQPDKETRKRIKALAKQNNVYKHEIINGILRSYFDIEDLARARKIHIENHFQTFEEWKKEKMASESIKEVQKHQVVKPKKIIPEGQDTTHRTQK